MNTELRLFRTINGVRREVRITITAERDIISEELVPVVGEGDIPPAALPPQLAQLQARGIKFHTDGAGRLVIDSVPPREQEILSFFNNAKPCWFGGCNELRHQYNTELALLGGSGCADCDKGALIRKYIPLVDELLPRQ